LEQAEEAICQCFAILDSYQVLYHPLIRKGVLVYAQVMKARQKPAEADRMFERMIRAQQEHFGKRHPFVADTLTSYAAAARGLHSPSWEAQKLNEALSIYREGPQTPRELFIDCLKALGSNLSSSDPAAAEPLLRQCLELTQRRYGERGPNVAAVQNLLAAALLRHGKTDSEVERLLIEARKISGSILSGLTASPVDRCDVLLNLAKLHRLRKQPAEAVKLLRECRDTTRNNANRLAEVAREFLRCAELSGNRDDCEREALATLRQAVKRGLKVSVLETDAAFDPLRQRPEFRELLPRPPVKPMS
jgi:hypothetical protein